jgi:hypothetical protein
MFNIIVCTDLRIEKKKTREEKKEEEEGEKKRNERKIIAEQLQRLLGVQLIQVNEEDRKKQKNRSRRVSSKYKAMCLYIRRYTFDLCH